jgi:hypothetical protein
MHVSLSANARLRGMNAHLHTVAADRENASENAVFLQGLAASLYREVLRVAVVVHECATRLEVVALLVSVQCRL